MDLSKLNANERLAFWGAVIAIVGTILTIVGGYGFAGGGLWLTVILALAMIVILFLPTWSPQSTLPGSRGSLMLVVGGIAAVGAVLSLLTLFAWIGLLGEAFLFVIGLLLGIVGGLMMGWGAWQAFQAEGGKFQLGTAPSGAGATAPPPATTDTVAPTPSEPPAERTADSTVDTAAADAAPPARDPDQYIDREDRPTS
jgi:hypothetical protein